MNNIFEIGISRNFNDENEFEYKMVVENEIPPFLSLSIRSENGNETLCYDIASMNSLKDLSTRKPLTYIELCMLVDSISMARQQVREYLLTLKGIILSPERIYYDSYNRQIKFAYNPAHNVDEFVSYTELTEFLLTAIDYKDEDAVKLAYELYAAVLNKDFEFEKYVDMNRYREYMEKVSEQVRTEEYKAHQIEPQYIEKRETDNRSIEVHSSKFDTVESLPRLSYFSVICITLFIAFVTLMGVIYVFDSIVIIQLISNTKCLVVIALSLAILIYFPIMNISDVKRARRRLLYQQSINSD